MDFFRDQERARSQTKLLVLLFVLAVMLIITAIYFTLLFAFGQPKISGLWQPKLAIGVSAGTLITILGGSIYKIAELSSGGGAAVARSMGARLVLRETDNLLERRLLNVVDEMAIASGVSVPRVYVMDDESSINAFAAGARPSEAVVAVTRGCLEKLDRDELQGVIGHEFSHIFNGDMRLNLRLMGILHGILIIALLGRIMMRARSGRGKNQNAAVLLGLAFFCIGYIGVFFGNLIKAAVSRQREFLADAAAVQYTRNPDGITGALQKIGGLHNAYLSTPNAEQASHMFFSEALDGWLATHPPIDERIIRLKPEMRVLLKHQSSKKAPSKTASSTASGFTMTSEAIVASVGTLEDGHLKQAQRLIAQLPESVSDCLHVPEEAASVIYALLVSREQDPSSLLAKHLIGAQALLIERSLSHLSWVRTSNRALWLPMVELALPAIRELSAERQLEVICCAKNLAQADERISLFEFALLALLEPKTNKIKSHKPDLTAIRSDINLLLSLLAHAGKKPQFIIEKSFAAATALSPLSTDWHLVNPKSVTLEVLAGMLERLNTLRYSFKAKLIEACTAAILEDGEVSLLEYELLRAIGARLECPLPPLSVSTA